MNVLEVRNVTKRFAGTLAVDGVSFSVGRQQIVALLGPSGCGKTTNLRMIAGFETPDSGAIVISGRDMERRPPYERNVGLLFQDYALFPHMTVAENIAYGLRRRRVPRDAIARRVAEMLALVKLTGFDERLPGRLSGGQQQRVALARALATKPEVLLLDEPLSALDAKLREALRVELKEILAEAGSTTIVVTHDQEEAMSLAERVIVMNRGRIMQEGAPEEIYGRPANRFVADFIGRTNWFAGTLGGAGDGVRPFTLADGTALRVRAAGEPAGPRLLCVRPERMLVEAAGAAASGPEANRLPGTVIDSAVVGADMHHAILLAGGLRVSATVKNVGRPPHAPGAAVVVAFAPADGTLIAEEPA